jgi:ADP-ribosylglycohydrolase
MLGAIFGDVVGSTYEWQPTKKTDFDLFVPECRYTDDTVLTVAVAECILDKRPWDETLARYAKRYPDVGYGGRFMEWIEMEDKKPYDSFGNGSAMRVSPVAWAYDSLEQTLSVARETALPTHSHPEGIKGAQAVAAAIFLARTGASKRVIGKYIEGHFNYMLSSPLERIRKDYEFDVSCQGSVPEALVAFMESDSVEDAVRKAVSLGGDADTQACIAGAVAEAFFGGIPSSIVDEIRSRIPKEFWAVILRFRETYVLPKLHERNLLKNFEK